MAVHPRVFSWVSAPPPNAYASVGGPRRLEAGGLQPWRPEPGEFCVGPAFSDFARLADLRARDWPAGALAEFV